MSNVKKENINFWTVNVPGIDNRVSRDLAGSKEFYEKIDSIRFMQEPYLKDFFSKILKPDIYSLEVGFGLGTDLRAFSQSGLKVTGLDYSPENAYLTDLGFKALNISGRVVSGDAEALPFADNSFDLVYSWGCLHHTPGTQDGIDELLRVLRPGGKVMVMLYHKGYQYWYMLLTYLLTFKWLVAGLQDYISLKYDQAPLSQIFSKSQLFKMFKKFEKVNIEVVTFGGIQLHPVLKYVWKIFQKAPWLMKRFGSFAIISANKAGHYQPAQEQPEFICPNCKQIIPFERGEVNCLNPSCQSKFFMYKNSIPILHPNAEQIAAEFTSL